MSLPGQQCDLETGLHYNRYRYYDPAIGRYASADPIGQAGGTNVFMYAGGDPAGRVDPYGLTPIIPDDWNLPPGGFNNEEGSGAPDSADCGGSTSQGGAAQRADSGSFATEASEIATELDPNSQAARIRADEKLRTAANAALGKSNRLLGPGDGPLGTGFRPDGTLTQTSGPMADGGVRATGSIILPERASGLAGIGVALPPGYSVLSTRTINAGFNASVNAFGVPVFTIRGPSGVLVTEQGFAPVLLPGGLR